MAFTNSIDTATPAGTDAPSVIDNRIREAKAGWQERLNVDHYMPLTGTQVSDNDAGEHRQVTFHEPISTPSASADHGYLYLKDVDSVVELFWIDESGNELQLTTGGVLNVTGADLLGKLANDTYLTAVDNAGTGTVDLIKADANDVMVVPDDSQTASDAAPTADKSIVNKKYVDDTAAMTPSSYAGEESITFNNGLVHKKGSVSVPQDSSQAVVFAAAFPTAIEHIFLSEVGAIDIDSQGTLTYQAATVSGFMIRKGTDNTTTVHWFAIGY